jgi:sugar lactone lactonase YvrE/enterochelin esterase-like enzyme
MTRSKTRGLISLLLLLASLSVVAAQTTDTYEAGPDSKPQPGVPKGETLKFSFNNSKIFPGTSREYWVYIPAQYTPDKPACVYIGQDGIQLQAPTVFDNLIHKKEMPVTIGIFVMHGKVNATNAASALDRFNRSYEYDGLGDSYARFLLEELLPDVENKKTSDGRPIRISHNGNDRAIGGLSSGAIAAFTAAWERPAEFTRVFSCIGTYVGLRGGHVYPTLVRKFEPKAIRIFLQDGSNDLNIYAGDWWMENQTMERALTFAGYEVQHIWGDGAHNGKQATAVFPDALRWLWKDYPTPVKTGSSKNATLNQILIPGEDWQLVAEGYKFVEGPATNASGEVFFNDVPDNKTYKIGLDGKVIVINPESKRADGQAFGPGGQRFTVATKTQQILAYDLGGKARVVAKGFIGNDIVVASNGNAYVTGPPQGGSAEPSKVWLIRPNGDKTVVDTGLIFSNGITLSPDQTLLYVTDSRTHWAYCFVIGPDGTLSNKQRYIWIHSPDTLEWSGADGMRVDEAGRVYIATAMGIQVADQLGRIQCILPTPNGRVANLTFGGKDRDTLFVMSGDKIYKRKLKVRGAFAWDKPVKPPQPGL